MLNSVHPNPEILNTFETLRERENFSGLLRQGTQSYPPNGRGKKEVLTLLSQAR